MKSAASCVSVCCHLVHSRLHLAACSNPHKPISPAAGRADIAAGQRTLESKLDTLLQRQQAVRGWGSWLGACSGLCLIPAAGRSSHLTSRHACEMPSAGPNTNNKQLKL